MARTTLKASAEGDRGMTWLTRPNGRAPGGGVVGELRDLTEEREAQESPHLLEGTDSRVEQVGDEGEAHAQGPAGDQCQGERQGHERLHRRGQGVRRLDDLGPDAAEVADELGLLELIHDRVEQEALAIQVAPQARLGQEVDLRLLGDGQVAVELVRHLFPHRLDRLEASLGGVEQVADLGLLDPAPDVPGVLLHLGHLLLDLPDLGVLRSVTDRQLLLFLVELAEVVHRGGRCERLGAGGEVAVRLFADQVHGVGDGPKPDPLLREILTELELRLELSRLDHRLVARPDPLVDPPQDDRPSRPVGRQVRRLLAELQVFPLQVLELAG